MTRQARHRIDVGFLRALGHPAQLERIEHALT